MLKFKALYKKMMDDLKDADMLLGWAKDLEKSSAEVAKFLYASAKTRVTSDFPQAKQLFEQMCEMEKEKGSCYLREVVDEELSDWHESLEARLKKF